MKKKATAQQETRRVTVRPRLVKADEIAAREAALAEEAERKAEMKAKLPADPALLRTPRNATEARSMFEALFGKEAA
jgi:hypothetical protein